MMRAIVCAVAVGSLASPWSAAAQATGAGTPFPAVFGGSVAGANDGGRLAGTVTLTGAYQDSDDAPETATEFAATGYHTSLAGTLAYGWRSQRLELNASAGGTVRHYTESDGVVGISQSGAFGLAANLGATRVTLTQSVDYSPAYFLGLFPAFGPAIAASLPAVADFSVTDSKALSYATTASVTQDLTRTASVEFFSGLQRTEFASETGYGEPQSYSVGARFRQGVTRYSKLRLGYTYRDGQLGPIGSTASTTVHDLDTGIDYARPLSLSRRTQLDFNVGSSIVSRPDDATESQQDLQYQIVGGATLNHQIGRTWRAQLAFNRGVGFVGGFPDLLFTDAVRVSLAGFVNRRVDVSLSGGYSSGRLDVAGSAAQRGATDVDSYVASSRLQFALTRRLAMVAEHVYYRFQSGSAIQLPTGVAPDVERQVVHAGLTWWIPF